MTKMKTVSVLMLGMLLGFGCGSGNQTASGQAAGVCPAGQVNTTQAGCLQTNAQCGPNMGYSPSLGCVAAAPVGATSYPSQYQCQGYNQNQFAQNPQYVNGMNPQQYPAANYNNCFNQGGNQYYQNPSYNPNFGYNQGYNTGYGQQYGQNNCGGVNMMITPYGCQCVPGSFFVPQYGQCLSPQQYGGNNGGGFYFRFGI